MTNDQALYRMLTVSGDIFKLADSTPVTQMDSAFKHRLLYHTSLLEDAYKAILANRDKIPHVGEEDWPTTLSRSPVAKWFQIFYHNLKTWQQRNVGYWSERVADELNEIMQGMLGIRKFCFGEAGFTNF